MIKALPRPRISVIIPTYRRFEPLLDAADNLLSQLYEDFEIVVADQNPEWPEELKPRLTAVLNDSRVHWIKVEQPGVVKARNLAVQKSSGELLLFVDDDVLIPNPHFLFMHARNFADPSVAAVVGREYPSGEQTPTISGAADARSGIGRFEPVSGDLTPLQQTLWFDRNSAEPKQVCTFCTCNSSIRRPDFLAIGGFDELFAGNSYGDDYDLALRLHRRSKGTVYDPDAWLIHRRSPMGGLRLTDATNRIDPAATAQGLWLFVLRHGYPGIYYHLVYRHVLRKTILMRRSIFNLSHQTKMTAGLFRGFIRAWQKKKLSPQSIFS